MYSKKHLWLITLVSAVVIAAALYSQYVLKMDPCPLCIFQRVAVMFVGCNLLVDILCVAIDPRLRNRGQA